MWIYVLCHSGFRERLYLLRVSIRIYHFIVGRLDPFISVSHCWWYYRCLIRYLALSKPLYRLYCVQHIELYVVGPLLFIASSHPHALLQYFDSGVSLSTLIRINRHWNMFGWSIYEFLSIWYKRRLDDHNIYTFLLSICISLICFLSRYSLIITSV